MVNTLAKVMIDKYLIGNQLLLKIKGDNYAKECKKEKLHRSLSCDAKGD